ncbi:MAG: 3-oxoacyl-[acyl-carrier-protein] reductase [Candidatus Margulisiibacteriota bacterium]|nr:3-oxoacyl-[acyl-carrier-protein] reductase [Candidatus Margulisiibacteriota bacterium]
MGFNENVIVVTGASRGIGLAIAESFAQAGGTIAICSTNQEKAEQTASDISTKYGVKAIGKGVDISCFDSTSAFIGDVVNEFGKIDVLINNAGITRDNLLLRMNKDEWGQVIDTNLNSVFNTTKAAIKFMLKKKYGRIINVSSVVGLMGNPGQSNYAASKAGMIAFTKSIAKEYGKKNITINAIAPGFIQTDMIETLPKDYLDNIIENIPMSRLGMPDDVSRACKFLASEDANYITGQVLSIDGGLYM